MAKYQVETEDGAVYEIETEEATKAPSVADTAVEASKPSEMLKVASPSNVGKLVGVAASNAPGAASLAVNAIPGVGNPTAIVPAVQNAVQNLGQLGDAVKRMVQVQGGSELADKEKFLAKVGEGAGTAVEMVMPTALAAPGVKNVARAVTPGAKAEVGKAIGAAERAAGVQEQVPTVANVAKRLDLPPRERSFADIVNSVKAKIENKEPINPQDLVDFKDLVKQQYGANKIAKGTRLDALTARTNKAAEAKLNELIKGRGPLSKDYAQINRIQNGIKVLAKAGAGAAGTGLAGLLLKKLAGY